MEAIVVRQSLIAYREFIRAKAAEAPSVINSGAGKLRKEVVRQYNSLADSVNEAFEPVPPMQHFPTEEVGSYSSVTPLDVLDQLNMAFSVIDSASESEPNSSIAAENETAAAASLNGASRPSIFIGCSVEGLPAAKFLQLELVHGAKVVIWHQGVFGLSQGTLESLVAECHNHDYAVLVLTPDDVVNKRGNQEMAARDNVLFELGLFMGALGRDRVFMAVEKGVELPTDLAGITPARFEREPDGKLPIASMGPVATRLQVAMGLL